MKIYFKGRGTDEEQTEFKFNSLFEEFSFTCKSRIDFENLLNKKIGLLIIYSKENLNQLLNLQDELKKKENEYIYDILRENYCVYSLSNLSKEAEDICFLLNIQKYSSISIINKENKGNLSSEKKILDKSMLIYNSNQIENITYLQISDIIIQHIHLLPSDNQNNDLQNKTSSHSNNEKSNNYQSLNNKSYNQTFFEEENPSSPGKLIEKQKKELKKLEIDMENKKKQIQIEEEVKNKEKNELERKKNEEKKKKEEILSILPEEPSSLNEDSTLIIFRYPHSEVRRERRFLKSDKIQNLYLFVKSLGTEMFEENINFELITPFPMKVYNDMEKSLFEEKLFPNAVIQIREKNDE